MNRLFSLIEVSGDDADEFLQGQLTQDVHRLATMPGLPAAWCNAKGRVLVIMRLFGMGGDRFGLVVPRSSAETLIQRLTMFRLRARVDVAPADDGWVARATRSPEDLETLESMGLLPEPGRFSARMRDGIVAFDTGAALPCIELFGTASAFGAAGLRLRRELGDADWRTALVEAGIPHIEGETREKFTAHMLNLDLLGAISFDKGCYAGQEVIARTQHLGQSKRRLLRYRLESASASPGDKLAYEGRDAAEVVDAAGPDLLAVAPLELIGETLFLQGVAAAPVELPYAIRAHT